MSPFLVVIYSAIPTDWLHTHQSCHGHFPLKDTKNIPKSSSILVATTKKVEDERFVPQEPSKLHIRPSQLHHSRFVVSLHQWYTPPISLANPEEPPEYERIHNLSAPVI
jgi:hypothetical protein